MTSPIIGARQFEVLLALKQATEDPVGPGFGGFDNSRGWFLATQLIDKKLVSGSDVRPVLLELAESGLVDQKAAESGRYFRVSKAGVTKLGEGNDGADQIVAESSTWTGIIEPPKVFQALAILNDMENVCEQITNNHDRAQIFGLIRALEILLTLPEPPRGGVVGLLRDDAFANVIEVATFILALIAVVKP